MEKVRCNLCGADDTRLLFVGHDRLHDLPGEFPVVECRECGLIYQNPQLDAQEILPYYPEHYVSYYTPIENETFWFRRLDRQRGVRRRCGVVQKRVPEPGKLLDIGCGTAIFIDGMHQLGWQVFGSDLNPQVIEEGRTRFDFDLRAGLLEEIGYPDGFFDVVTMWDVIEHVHDPRSTLLEIGRILKPGGWVFLNTPHPEGLNARLYGRTWIGWDVPRHLYLISPAVMSRYLAETGFGPPEIISFTGRHGAMLLNLELALDERVSQPKLREGLMAVARSLPVRLLTWPFHWLLEQFNQALTYTAIARVVDYADLEGEGGL